METINSLTSIDNPNVNERQRLTTVGGRIPPKLKARLVERAGELGVTQSQLLRRILEDALEIENVNVNKNSESSQDSLAWIVRIFGESAMEGCKEIEAGLCTYWNWKDARTEGLETVRHKDKTLARPTPELCGFCYLYKLGRTPITNLTDEFECSECGSKDLVAIRFKCTNCGKKSWWGTWPKKRE